MPDDTGTSSLRSEYEVPLSLGRKTPREESTSVCSLLEHFSDARRNICIGAMNSPAILLIYPTRSVQCAGSVGRVT